MGETISPPDENPQIEPFEYVTEDGEATFKFNLVACTTESGQKYYEIDITDHPPYDKYGRKETEFDNHKTASKRGGEMVCIGDYPAATPTIEDAKKWASIWGKFTWRYIKTGEDFPR